MNYFLFYAFVGTICAIWYRWPDDEEGFDLLLDVALWPMMLYVAWREGGRDG